MISCRFLHPQTLHGSIPAKLCNLSLKSGRNYGVHGCLSAKARSVTKCMYVSQWVESINCGACKIKRRKNKGGSDHAKLCLTFSSPATARGTLPVSQAKLYRCCIPYLPVDCKCSAILPQPFVFAIVKRTHRPGTQAVDSTTQATFCCFAIHCCCHIRCFCLMNLCSLSSRSH